MESQALNRIIGTYSQGMPGPMMICIGGMHGNEKAGVKAIELMVKMLEVEPITNPEFKFHGTFIGIIGNLEAYSQNVRYMEKDLNRQWLPERVNQIIGQEYHELSPEDRQIHDVISLVRDGLIAYQPNKVYIIDLHTTSADGGIFTIVPDDPYTVEFAKSLTAPVILGMLDGLKGTTLHYFNASNFPGFITSLCFEAGQHEDPLSVNRCIAAITNSLSFSGCIDVAHVENIHTRILAEYAHGLPKLSRLKYKHHIAPDDHFVMRPGFKNFDPVALGDHLADDAHGEILAPMEGFLLMPLYQTQGEDGFFIVQSL